MEQVKVINGLVSVLLDSSNPIADRDDAAMDLAYFDEDAAFDALVLVGSDESVNEIILWSCGSSLGEIWLRRGEYEQSVFDSLSSKAKQEAQIMIGLLKAV